MAATLTRPAGWIASKLAPTEAATSQRSRPAPLPCRSQLAGDAFRDRRAVPLMAAPLTRPAVWIASKLAPTKAATSQRSRPAPLPCRSQLAGDAFGDEPAARCGLHASPLMAAPLTRPAVWIASKLAPTKAEASLHLRPAPLPCRSQLAGDAFRDEPAARCGLRASPLMAAAPMTPTAANTGAGGHRESDR